MFIRRALVIFALASMLIAGSLAGPHSDGYFDPHDAPAPVGTP